jgi:hypothetical protein
MQHQLASIPNLLKMDPFCSVSCGNTCLFSARAGGSPPNQPPVVYDIIANLTDGDVIQGWQPWKYSINIDLLEAATDADGDQLSVARVQMGCCGTDDYDYSIERLVLQTSPEVRSNSVYTFTLKFLQSPLSDPCPQSMSFTYYVTDGKSTSQATVQVVPLTSQYSSCGEFICWLLMEGSWQSTLLAIICKMLQLHNYTRAGHTVHAMQQVSLSSSSSACIC